MKKKQNGREEEEGLILELYVAGMAGKSMRAIENVKRFCDDYPEECFDVQIIDIYKHPEIAVREQIVFCPSLIKRKPLPQRIFIGDFTDTKKLVKQLGITLRDLHE